MAELSHHNTAFKFTYTYAISCCIILLVTLTTGCYSQNILELNISKEIAISSELSEISGMIYDDNGVYAINDSGNGAIIYYLDKNDFSIISKYKPKGLKNHDWEEVSLYGDSLFIGDFGNNFGNRRDLTIYSLPISGIIGGRDGFTRRSFTYSLQESYSNIPHTHRWDCESMIIFEKKIILFSKDWQKQESLIYNIDRSNLNSELSPVDSLNLGFLVTGAFLERISSTLYLCGYFDGSTYLAIIDNFGESSLVAEYRKFSIKGLEGKQIESIFVMDGKIFLASEAKQVKQALYIIEKPL